MVPICYSRDLQLLSKLVDPEESYRAREHHQSELESKCCHHIEERFSVARFDCHVQIDNSSLLVDHQLKQFMMSQFSPVLSLKEPVGFGPNGFL